MFVKRTAGLATGTLALMGLLLATGPAHAQLGNQQGWPFAEPRSSSALPWNSSGYRGYSEPQYVAQPIILSAPMGQPKKYEAYVNALPMSNTKDPNVITLVAHVPENAQIWVQDKATTSTGTLRTFESPSLTPGKTSHYEVRIAWIEDGKVVSQTRKFAAKTGDVHCVYLVRSDSKLEGKTDKVQANLSKLSPEDRKLAVAQGYCAVQNGSRLGGMGTPVKITVKGQPVFLCCAACRERAEANPEKTVAKVKELNAHEHHHE